MHVCKRAIQLTWQFTGNSSSLAAQDNICQIYQSIFTAVYTLQVRTMDDDFDIDGIQADEDYYTFLNIGRNVSHQQLHKYIQLNAYRSILNSWLFTAYSWNEKSVI